MCNKSLKNEDSREDDDEDEGVEGDERDASQNPQLPLPPGEARVVLSSASLDAEGAPASEAEGDNSLLHPPPFCESDGPQKQ